MIQLLWLWLADLRVPVLEEGDLEKITGNGTDLSFLDDDRRLTTLMLAQFLLRIQLQLRSMKGLTAEFSQNEILQRPDVLLVINKLLRALAGKNGEKFQNDDKLARNLLQIAIKQYF